MMVRCSDATCPSSSVGVADQLVHDPPRRRRERLARVGDEDGALALAQVVARRLSGLALVAEHAEHVIAQLEGHPERMPERGERGRLREIRPRERGADRERLLHAVAGGLEGCHAQRARGVAFVGLGAEGRLLGDVEELADRHLAPHARRTRCAPRRQRGGRLGESLLEEVVAPGDEEVAEQDGRRPAERRGIPDPSGGAVRALECAMRGGPAAAGVGVVDDVVVHERGRVEDLERGRGGHDGVRELAGRPRRPRRPRASRRGRTVRAAAFRRATRRRRFDEKGRFGAESAVSSPLTRDKVVQSLGNRFDRVRGGWHGPSLVIYGTRRIYAREPQGGCMPLSEQEQRLLDEMERHLMRNDADVVTAPREVAAELPQHRYGFVLVLLGLGGLIVGVATDLEVVSIIVGVIGFLVNAYKTN